MIPSCDSTTDHVTSATLSHNISPVWPYFLANDIFTNAPAAASRPNAIKNPITARSRVLLRILRKKVSGVTASMISVATLTPPLTYMAIYITFTSKHCAASVSNRQAAEMGRQRESWMMLAQSAETSCTMIMPCKNTRQPRLFFFKRSKSSAMLILPSATAHPQGNWLRKSNRLALTCDSGGM